MAAREYSSARAQAAKPALPAGEMPGVDAPVEALLGWVAQDPGRARQALAVERARAVPRPAVAEALEQLLPHFRLDGVRWVLVVDDLTVLDVTDLARMSHVDADSPQGAAALGEFFETVLGLGAYRQFKAHCRQQKTPDEVLLEIMGGLVEDLTGRPTQPPSPSPAGREPTLEQSRVVSPDGTVRPMTSEEFAAWRETQAYLGERAQQLLAQGGPPTPPGFAYSG